MSLLTSKEAAADLRITVKQLLGFAREGEIKYIDLSRRGNKKKPYYRFEPEDLAAFKERRKRCDESSPHSSSHRAKNFMSPMSRSNSGAENASVVVPIVSLARKRRRRLSSLSRKKSTP